MENKPLTGLWRDNPETPEGKYLVKRRDGTVVEWSNFVMGSRDPAAPAGLRGYADKAEELGMNSQYVAGVRRLAARFEKELASLGPGDPDRGRHRKDDPATVLEMRKGGSA